MDGEEEGDVKDKYSAFLAALTAESELYALFGRGYPHSFYKAYVRATPKGKWWRIKQGGRPVAYDPHRQMQSYPREGRLGALVGPIGYFLLYEHIASDGLTKLRARIVELQGEANCHLQIVNGPRTKPTNHDERTYPQ